MCIALVVALIATMYFVFGQGIVLLIIIFPATVAQNIAKKHGLHLIGKSLTYLSLLCLFIATEVLLLALIFFGIYCLFGGVSD